MTDLLAIGGAHIDAIAKLSQPHIFGASNPVSFSNMVGGGALNALRIAKLRGIKKVAMISLRGGDANAILVEEELEKAGITDLSGVFLNRPTPSYTAIIDKNGDLITALSDTTLYEQGFEKHVRRKQVREHTAKANAILIDANLPKQAIEYICTFAKGPVFAMCISPAKAPRLESTLQNFEILFLNKSELMALTNMQTDKAAIQKLLNKGVKQIVITDGKKPLTVATKEYVKKLKIPSQGQIYDVTSAGDSLTGGTIAAILNKQENIFINCVMQGIACAQFALYSNGPLCEPIETQAFNNKLEQIKACNTT